MDKVEREKYREKAKIIRLLVVMTLIVAKARHTRGSLFVEDSQ